MTPDALVMRDIEKSFSRTPVLRGASFTLRRGECHALMGENGAGKSTLMKVLAGVHTCDAGTVELDGKPVAFGFPREAEAAGIAMIYQEFSLVPPLTVAQNIFLGHEPKSLRGGVIRDREMLTRARDLLAELGERIDPRARVETLSVGAKQIVEIAKALSKNARIIVMDEPTASLSEEEAERLFALVRKLKADGISIVYISHRMSEIFRICDRITAMRDGLDILTADAADVSMEELIHAMLGDDNSSTMHWVERETDLTAPPLLSVRDLRVRDMFADVSFDIRPGEIVGLAGLTGAGRTEIAETVFGLRSADAGTITIGGRTIRSTRDAIDAGAAFVPEDRRTQGLVLDHSIKDNIILPSLNAFRRGGMISDSAARKATRQHIASLRIRAERPGQVVRFLSGGNQQKIVLAKWLERAPKLLILDEPTIGVDIGAKADLVDTIRQAADAGTAVLVISSEFEELLAVSDRLLIIHDGRLIREMPRKAVASEEVLHHAVQG